MLTPKEIDELAVHLERQFQNQKKDDTLDKEIIRQKHIIEAQKDKTRKVQPVGTGYGKLVTKQNFSFLSQRPFIAYNAPRDTLKEHAEMLEAATQGMGKLSGLDLAWLRSIQDVVDVGRGWLLIHYVPQLWQDLDFSLHEGESQQAYDDRIEDLKLANWPIVAQHIDVRNVWPTRTLKGEVDQVVEIRQMSVRQIKEAYDITVPDKTETELLKVLVYADHTHMRTIIAKHGGLSVLSVTAGGVEAMEASPPWEHHLGMNPYVLMEAPPVPENDDNVMWEGSIAPLRHLIPEMDGALTDYRHNTKRISHSQLILTLDLDARKQLFPEAKTGEDLITIEPDEPIIMNLNEGIGDQFVGGAQTNPDIPGLLGIMRSFTQENAIRPALLGILEQAGDSGVRYNTGAQLAQKQFGPAIDFLQTAAENVAKHFLAGIIAFSETFNDIPGLEDDTIPIYFVDSKNISKRLNLKASDVKGWGDRIQAKIELAIPLNQNAQIMTARLAADPVGGVMSLETAMESIINIANPLEEIRKRDLDKIRAALTEQRVQAAQQIGFQIAAAPANADALAQDFAALPATVQQGIQLAAQQQGRGVPEARGAANSVRTGRGQQPTEGVPLSSGV